MILCLSQFAHLFVERRHFDGQHQTCQHLLTIFVYTPTFLPRFSLCLFHEWKFFATYRSYDQSQVVSDVIRHLFFLNRSKGVEKNENIISEKKKQSVLLRIWIWYKNKVIVKWLLMGRSDNACWYSCYKHYSIAIISQFYRIKNLKINGFTWNAWTQPT